MPIPVAIAALAKTLAASGLSLLGNAVLAKGKEYVEEKLGVNLEQEVQTEDGRIRLLQLQIDREEMLNDFVLAQRAQDLQEIEIHLKDVADSRQANAVIQQSVNASWLAKNTSYILDYVIVISTIGLITALIFRAVPEGNKEIAYAMLGSLLTLCGIVFQWHRGSSAGSSRKTDEMVAQLKEKR